ncbi:methylated-DNA--[protein]-cysteine S-methyltransferase [Clostridium malenominatum]|uniref:Methylated-DNA--protein-cysteine methyltransferase n=1 Tax=Clostridium malenominatum TaxID=1539 RepID=A0ABN1J298_9CLOT
MNTGYYKSPIGVIELIYEDDYLLGLNFVNEDKNLTNEDEFFKKCSNELDEYFLGARKTFSINCKLNGTVFQKKVWQSLLKIPYGRTCSYKDIALNIENPKAVRAVGGANNKNKISIVIPCHRVIGSNGSLVGYGGDLWRKEWLLAHEKKYLDK